jgi:septal ring factor EnvC (AmiA/AmiB activator)
MALQILFTALAVVCVFACFLAVTRTDRTLDRCKDWADQCASDRGELLEDRHRLTSVERDVAALRRELRKLSGKFYSTLSAIEEREADEFDASYDRDQDAAGDSDRQLDAFAGIQNLEAQCENWKAAQTLGPSSDAAKCECVYCLSKRAERRALRSALVPKTVQGQAELARLNSGKP